MLQVSGISFRYGSVQALHEVSFDVSRGITALLGVNGAGKSTLLSVCAGILPPGAGKVEVSSWPLYGARKPRRNALRAVAIMPQSVSFPGALTSHDIVSYMGWLKGLSGSAASKRADACLDAVGLTEQRNRRAGALSGGMVRRLAFAQALVAEPDVILLDEPSTGLDPAQRRTMVELIRSLDCAVLFSSHVVEDIEDLAERVLVLDQGRLVFDGGLPQLTEGITEEGRRSPVEAGFLRLIGAGGAK